MTVPALAPRSRTAPAATRPTAPGALKVMTFNVHLGGTAIGRATTEIARGKPDVVMLQEVSRAKALGMAKQLGMHMSYAAGRSKTGGTLPWGKAVLSKHPIVSSHDVRLPNAPGAARLAAGDNRNIRTALHATLNVRGQKVDVVNAHLSVVNRQSNALQIDRLAAMSRLYGRDGRAVVVGGDFNHNLNAVKTGTASSESLANLRAVSEGRDSWSDDVRRTATVGGRIVTPRSATGALRAAVVGGVTGAMRRSRLDGLFANNARILATHLNLDSRASDHRPVASVVRL